VASAILNLPPDPDLYRHGLTTVNDIVNPIFAIFNACYRSLNKKMPSHR